MSRFALLTGLLLVTAGCVTKHGPAPTADSAPASTAQDSGVADTPETSQSPRTVSVLVALDPEGLRFVTMPSGSTRLLAFGAEEDRAIAALTALNGTPSDRGTNPECGAGPLAYAGWGDGLMAWFSDGIFAGWMVNGRRAGAEHYTTMSGIGVGSTRAEIEQVYVIDVEQTSLGTEFAAGDLYGLLSGPAPGDTVTHLWAGTTCIFR